jgi:hypothetical protein
MALALNVFKTITQVISFTPTEVYIAPPGYSGVVLLAQVANIGSSSHDVTVIHRRGANDTEILKNYPISANDSLSLFTGKLVLETGDKLLLSGSDSSNLKFIASILETIK